MAGIFVAAERLAEFHAAAREWIESRFTACLEGAPQRGPDGRTEILLRVDAGLVELMRRRGFPFRDEGALRPAQACVTSNVTCLASRRGLHAGWRGK